MHCKLENESVQEAEYMRNYLQKGSIMRYDLKFTGSRKVEHLPIKENKRAGDKVESDIDDRDIEVINDTEREMNSETRARLKDRNENKVNEHKVAGVSGEKNNGKTDDKKFVNEKVQLERTKVDSAGDRKGADEKSETSISGRSGTKQKILDSRNGMQKYGWIT